MRATLLVDLKCECGLVMLVQGDTATCMNEMCDHFHVYFPLPTVELELTNDAEVCDTVDKAAPSAS